MKTTRREAIRAGVLATVGVSMAGGEAQSEMSDALKEMPPLDYGRSFICHSADFNSVRFWVESRTRMIDEKAGTSTDYYQCASCKSENTFGEKDLFYEDNYDFLPILGDGRWLVFRRTVRLSEGYRAIAPVEKYWGPPILKLREAKTPRLLESWEEIRDVTAEAIPIVTQTEISNPEIGLRAIIECPTKTLNISHDKKMYQVDTGPIALPDLSQRFDPEIESLRLAFVAFNAPDFADFVVEQPTPVSEDGEGDCKVYHYSNPISLPAKNRVIALRQGG